ncbi:shikimate kinase I [Legionella nautarum]|uniref:Shikimate kinase n=1 Tax=Legionella nautarum TaxID=45070 RepID=A0A0W0WL41_9GAMM|nr:shikimate kinase [Legionella nautarum]KTD32822.1 shikimate kinase I [Legionella nautarum]
MKQFLNPIILIGFKQVGKTVIGRELASRLELPFIDLDEEIERMFASENKEKRTCQQIMKAHGQSYFRDLEKRGLAQSIQSNTSIISLGGGTPINKENQQLIKAGVVVHIEAPRGVVFERIMIQGRPAFYSIEESPLVSFNRLWNERDEIYKKLADLSIENNGLLVSAVDRILMHIL